VPQSTNESGHIKATEPIKYKRRFNIRCAHSKYSHTVNTIWNSLPDNVISALFLSTFCQRLKNISVPDFIPRRYHWSPLNYSPTFSGSWSDFITWTTLKIHWLTDGLIIHNDGARVRTWLINSMLFCSWQQWWGLSLSVLQVNGPYSTTECRQGAHLPI